MLILYETNEGVTNEQILSSVENLKEEFSSFAESMEATEEPTEEVTEQAATESNVVDLTFLTPVDHNLYLSSEVEYANINDLYSMMLSTRNILLLFFLMWAFVKLLGMFKSVIYRVMNK